GVLDVLGAPPRRRGAVPGGVGHEVTSSARRCGGIPADEELLRAARTAMSAIEGTQGISPRHTNGAR
ncbi:hypothetical protein ACFWJT_23940, partial [Streptomyces sp. NPDC127069]|uniref:hypothetical protein n=1 Tax=Streptomyces sp. NPDC127069 TaxID=3347128 RepID=UPI00364E16B6